MNRTSKLLEALSTRVAAGEDGTQIRIAIADAIGACLDERRTSLGYWEIFHLVQALTSIESPLKLRYSFAMMQKAIVPPERRAPQSIVAEKEIDSLGYQELAAWVMRVGEFEISAVDYHVSVRGIGGLDCGDDL